MVQRVACTKMWHVLHFIFKMWSVHLSHLLTAPQSVKEYSKPTKLDTNIICIYFEKKWAIYVGNVLRGKLRYAARRPFGTTREKTWRVFWGYEGYNVKWQVLCVSALKLKLRNETGIFLFTCHIRRSRTNLAEKLQLFVRWINYQNGTAVV